MKTWLKKQLSTVEGARNAVLVAAVVLGTLGFVIAVGSFVVF
jgi:hypothetical protein